MKPYIHPFQVIKYFSFFLSYISLIYLVFLYLYVFQYTLHMIGWSCQICLQVALCAWGMDCNTQGAVACPSMAVCGTASHA